MQDQCDSRSICDVRRLIATELLCRCDDIDLLVDWVGRAAVQPSVWGISWLCGYARGSWLNAMYSLRPTSPWRRCEGSEMQGIALSVWRSMGLILGAAKRFARLIKSVTGK